MSLYFTDEVQITNITRDQNFRTETPGTPYLSEAYVEDDDSIAFSSDGTPVKPIRRVFVPHGNIVRIGDLIKTTKLRGEVVTDTDRKVTAVFNAGSFSGSHLEIQAGSVSGAG